MTKLVDLMETRPYFSATAYTVAIPVLIIIFGLSITSSFATALVSFTLYILAFSRLGLSVAAGDRWEIFHKNKEQTRRVYSARRNMIIFSAVCSPVFLMTVSHMSENLEDDTLLIFSFVSLAFSFTSAALLTWVVSLLSTP